MGSGVFSGNPKRFFPGLSGTGTPRSAYAFQRKSYKALTSDFLTDPMLRRAERQVGLFSPAQARQQTMQGYLSGVNEQLSGIRQALAGRGGGSIGGAEQGARLRGSGMMQAILGGQQAATQAMQPNMQLLAQKYNILSALYGQVASSTAQTAGAISQRDVGMSSVSSDLFKGSNNMSQQASQQHQANQATFG